MFLLATRTITLPALHLFLYIYSSIFFIFFFVSCISSSVDLPSNKNGEPTIGLRANFKRDQQETDSWWTSLVADNTINAIV
ncbi:hypothetical protein M8C21_031715 [Ambrosia artemisiifolia]|uniref:Uncharacterized protein n=1 Tax=Ambrosia artemisiifolia TaxID=4212 RepID=A0AAD5G4I9_AMBAR|nr:hypothetical protein M8C21_031715 [Ambrosia artemisiifolia]